MEQGRRHKNREPDLLRQLGRLRQERLGGDARRVHQRPLQQQIHQLLGNGVQHDRAQDFIHSQACFQDSGDESPDGP